MDDADQGMEASAATIRDSVRRKNAVTLNHQQAIYTEKLRPSGVPTGWCSFFYVFECSATFIFDIFDIDLLEILAGSVAALVGVGLGLLSLLLGAYDPEPCVLAVIGILIGVVWFFVAVWIFFGLGRGMPVC